MRANKSSGVTCALFSKTQFRDYKLNENLLKTEEKATAVGKPKKEALENTCRIGQHFLQNTLGYKTNTHGCAGRSRNNALLYITIYLCGVLSRKAQATLRQALHLASGGRCSNLFTDDVER